MSMAPMPSPERTMGRQGHYAGAVSRLVAFAVDVVVAWLAYTLVTDGINAAVKLISGHPYALASHRVLDLCLLAGWAFFYFTYQWAVSGRTLGMATFGIQVVTAEGRPIGTRLAALRTLGLGLTLLTLGIGFLGIVYQRERRALDDFVAGTAVIYAWDARAARLRWLAHKDVATAGSEVTVPATAPPERTSPPPVS
jgi:uncharacterized RDD family membrane protein YckC